MNKDYMMKSSPLLSRYIARNFFIAFVASLSALMLLILLFDVIDLLRRAASREYATFGDVLSLAFLKLPQTLPLILPFAVLIGALITFYRLSRSNELVIVRSAGLSAWNFLMPVFIVVFLIGLFNVMLFNPFSTAMHKRYEIVEGIRFRKDKTISWSEQGLWLWDKKNGFPLIVHADAVKQQNQDLILSGVSVTELKSDETFGRQIESEKGSLKNGFLIIDKGVTFDYQGHQSFVENLTYPSDFDLDKIMRTFSEPETFSVWQIWGFIRMLDNSGFSSVRHRMHFYSVLASIFYLLAMVFIAAVFLLNPNQRSGHVLIRVSGAVLCGFLLFFLSKLVVAVGSSGSLPGILAGFGPSVVAISLCATVLLHLEDG